MITVHHLENSRSQRILWLLEELDVPYQIEHYKRDAATMLAPDSLRAVHPLGKSPVLTDDATTIAESGAIIDYMVASYGEGRLIPPEGTPARLRYTFWLHYAEGSAMPPLLMKLVFGVLPDRSPALLRPLVRAISGRAQSGFIDPQLKIHMQYWENELQKTAWFAGEMFTAADVQMSFPVEAAFSNAATGQAFPKLAAYLAAIHARPAYRRALERGGPYAYAS